MPTIYLKTYIQSSVDRVFDLARSIDLHKATFVEHNEKAIAGRTTGLIEIGETVTWSAVHLGVRQQLTSKVTSLEKHNLFTDEMVKGPFKYFVHSHHFKKIEGGVLMVDTFSYASPLGPLGKLADLLFLKRYLRRVLSKRNHFIKKVAESEQWRQFL